MIQQIQKKSLRTSTFLSRLYVKNMITPLQVIKVLNEHKVSFVLVGLHGLSGWMREPRATQDVDVVVAARHVKKAVAVLLDAFTNLEAVDLPVVTRLKLRGTDDVLIDVMKPLQQPHKEVFKNSVAVTEKGQTYRIPTVEMALALKFAPMVSLHRADKDKYQDAHDFILLVENNLELDSGKLAELGDLVYPGGSKEILELVRKARAGEKLII
ncbi:MAG: hypothetical protein L0Y72_12055 [Gemmataceae bacterium]|nr:hypothetical protein [Gemmataceae bacterium]